MEWFFQSLTDLFGGRNYSASQKMEEILYLAIDLRECANHFCNSLAKKNFDTEHSNFVKS